jgi:2-keto-4-pentenoate hydratase/2-oxohepta-3-ene-1,7-dioic acid hydratase in catechol pathway
MGPWAVTADAFDGNSARVRCWVNGELRQDANVENMIFDIPTLIETISRGITLYPGDLIATGTCANVGIALGKFLQPGDVVKVAIDGLGHIENRVDNETVAAYAQ